MIERLRALQAELDAAIEASRDGSPIDAFAVSVVSKKIAALIEMLAGELIP